MKRKKLTKRASKRVAYKGFRTEVKNLKAMPMRGGFRL